MTQVSFGKSDSGSVAMTFGLAIVPLSLMVGVALDYAKAGMNHVALQDVLDAGALAGARAHAQPNRESVVRSFVNSNINGKIPNTELERLRINFDDATSTVTVDADAKIKSGFLKIAGIDATKVTQVSAAAWSSSYNRIALALDTTGSLRNAGIDDDLRQAAKNFIDVVSKGSARPSNIYLSIIPFASMVNVGPSKTSWLSTKYSPANYSPASWAGCVYEPPAPHDIALDPPIAGSLDPHLWPKDYTAALGFNDWNGKPASDFKDGIIDADIVKAEPLLLGPNVGCMSPVLPLTNDMNAAKARVDDLVMLSGSGGTMLNIGLIWAWRTLSPDWAAFWRTGSAIEEHDKQDTGTIVFLSDGKNDWYVRHVDPMYGLGITGYGKAEDRRVGIGPAKSALDVAAEALGTTKTDPDLAAKIIADRNDPKKNEVDKAIDKLVSKSERDLEDLVDERFLVMCDRIKKAGFRIYTIAFGPQSNQMKGMRECASEKDMYFNSPSRADLDNAFKKISESLGNKTAIRLIR